MIDYDAVLGGKTGTVFQKEEEEKEKSAPKKPGKNPIAQVEKKVPLPPQAIVFSGSPDITEFKPGFAIFDQEIAKWENQAKDMQIIDQPTREMAVMIIGESTRLSKQVDTLRDDIWKPHLLFRKKLDSFVGTFTDRLSRIKNTLKAAERKFLDLEEMKRREAEKRAQDALEAEQKKINEQAAAKNIQPIKLEAPVIPPESVKMRTESGVSSYEHKEWRFEITDPEKVARKYCSPDEKKLKEAVKGGLREGMEGSEGLKIFEFKENRYRT